MCESAGEWNDTNYIDRLISCLRCVEKNKYPSLLSGNYEEILPTEIEESAHLNKYLLDLIRNDIRNVHVCSVIEDKSREIFLNVSRSKAFGKRKIDFVIKFGDIYTELVKWNDRREIFLAKTRLNSINSTRKYICTM